MYKTKIFIPYKDIYDIILPDVINRKRTKIELKKVKKGVNIRIISKDVTALRASFNNVYHIVKIYEEVNNLLNK